ncbi:MAG: hypothetical protein R3C18_08275 [Planctomycetaceae bacterium]
MFRVITFLVVLFAAKLSMAGDMLSIAFEDSTMTVDSERVHCDLYYILLGDDGAMEKGDLIQVSQLHEDREHYGVSRARFVFSDDMERLTVSWPAVGNEKVGSTEKARLDVIDADSLRISYRIDQHDDKSQVGQKLRARIVDFRQLPEWVRNEVTPSIIAKLPPSEQLLYHKMQAEQIRVTSEIINGYLDAID